MLLLRTQKRQFLRGKGENGTCHSRSQRNIPVWVINNLQKLKQNFNLRRLHQIAACTHVAGNTAFLQRCLIHPGNHAG